MQGKEAIALEETPQMCLVVFSRLTKISVVCINLSVSVSPVRF